MCYRAFDIRWLLSMCGCGTAWPKFPILHKLVDICILSISSSTNVRITFAQILSYHHYYCRYALHSPFDVAYRSATVFTTRWLPGMGSGCLSRCCCLPAACYSILCTEYLLIPVRDAIDPRHKRHLKRERILEVFRSTMYLTVPFYRVTPSYEDTNGT